MHAQDTFCFNAVKSCAETFVSLSAQADTPGASEATDAEGAQQAV